MVLIWHSYSYANQSGVKMRTFLVTPRSGLIKRSARILIFIAAVAVFSISTSLGHDSEFVYAFAMAFCFVLSLNCTRHLWADGAFSEGRLPVLMITSFAVFTFLVILFFGISALIVAWLGSRLL